MTAPHIVDPAGLLSQALADASPDLMRELLQTMINALLSADADAVCGAEWNARSAGRTNFRNGYRHRPLDTRVGTVEVAVPKLRSGSYFPEWLLEATSGQTQTRHRLSRGGDRQLNRALHTVILARAKHHQPTKDYLARRTAEGKTKREAMRCLKRYYARHLFRLLEAAPMTT